MFWSGLAAATGAALQAGVLSRALVPNDTFYASDQWNLYDSYGIHAPGAWDIERGSAGQVIAVLDTGILAHQDLDPGRILPGYDFVSDPVSGGDGDGRDADATDPGDGDPNGVCGSSSSPESSWHGLLVTGVIAAVTDNALGIAGIDWHARILPLRVLGKCGGDALDLADAVLWAVGGAVPGLPDNPTPATVINISAAGNGSCPALLQAAIDEARRRGAVVVVAAGNAAAHLAGGNTKDLYPANCNHVLTVTATDIQGDRLLSAYHGAEVALAAPGKGITTLSNAGTVAADPAGDRYVVATGTSLAAPHVAAAAAMVRAANPALTADEVGNLLRATARPFPAGSTCTPADCGAGILDLEAAVQRAGGFSGSTASSGTTGSGGGGGAMAGWLWLLAARVARRRARC